MAVSASEYIAQLTSPPFLVLAKSQFLRPITNGFIASRSRTYAELRIIQIIPNICIRTPFPHENLGIIFSLQTEPPGHFVFIVPFGFDIRLTFVFHGFPQHLDGWLGIYLRCIDMGMPKHSRNQFQGNSILIQMGCPRSSEHVGIDPQRHVRIGFPDLVGIFLQESLDCRGRQLIASSFDGRIEKVFTAIVSVIQIQLVPYIVDGQG